jgi:S-adenosylmethionine hydrolase
MKGVILSRCPAAQVIDISHKVPAQNVRVGALRVASAARYFPDGTVHVAVVDPGVGGPRRAIAIESQGHRFVGPDNGVLSLAAPRGSPGWRAVELTNRSLWLQSVSNTFHGRDVFAPVAAFLACGGDLDDLGQATQAVVELKLSVPKIHGDSIAGGVLDVDRFGNVITNIRAADLHGRPVVRVVVGGASVEGLATSYDAARPLVAVENSDGWIEIAAPGGSAAARLHVNVDDPVNVHLAPLS